MAKSAFNIESFKEGINPRKGTKDQEGNEGLPFAVGVSNFEPGKLVNAGDCLTRISPFGSSQLMRDFRPIDGLENEIGLTTGGSVSIEWGVGTGTQTAVAGDASMGTNTSLLGGSGYPINAISGHNGEGLFSFNTDIPFNLPNVMPGAWKEHMSALAYCSADYVRTKVNDAIPAPSQFSEKTNGGGEASSTMVAVHNGDTDDSVARFQIIHPTGDDSGNVATAAGTPDGYKDKTTYYDYHKGGKSNSIAKGDLFFIAVWVYNVQDIDPIGNMKIKFGGKYSSSSVYYDTEDVAAETVAEYTGRIPAMYKLNFNVNHNEVAADTLLDDDSNQFYLTYLVESPLDYTNIDADNDVHPCIEVEVSGNWTATHRVVAFGTRVVARSFPERHGGKGYTGLIYPCYYGTKKRFGLAMWDGVHKGDIWNIHDVNLIRKTTAANPVNSSLSNLTELDTGWAGIRYWEDIHKASWLGLGHDANDDESEGSAWNTYVSEALRFETPNQEETFKPLEMYHDVDISYEGGFLRLCDGAHDPVAIGKVMRTFMSDIPQAKHSICYDYFSSKLAKPLTSNIVVHAPTTTTTADDTVSSDWSTSEVDGALGNYGQFHFAYFQNASSSDIPDDLTREFNIGISYQYDDTRFDSGVVWSDSILDWDAYTKVPNFKLSFPFSGVWHDGTPPGEYYGKGSSSLDDANKVKPIVHSYFGQRVPLSGGLDPRAVGFKVWIAEGEEDPYMLMDVDLTTGRYSIPSGNVFNKKLDQYSSSNYLTNSFYTADVKIKALPATRYSAENSWLGSENTRARYKTSCVVGSVRYIGNVTTLDEDGNIIASHPDRILFSPPFAYDTFPELNYFQPVGADGDEIVKLFNFEQYLIVFKRTKILALNPETEVLEFEANDYGILRPNQACQTPHGICFVNNSGIYLFDGTKIENLTLERFGKNFNPVQILENDPEFDTEASEATVNTKKYGFIEEDLYPVIGYDVSRDQLIVACSTGGRTQTKIYSQESDRTGAKSRSSNDVTLTYNIKNRPGVIYDFATQQFAMQRYMLPVSIDGDTPSTVQANNTYDFTNFVNITNPETRENILAIGKHINVGDANEVRLFAYQDKQPSTNGLMSWGTDGTDAEESTNITKLSSYDFRTSNIDFDNTAARKKVYSIHITYKTVPRTNQLSDAETSSDSGYEEDSCITVTYMKDGTDTEYTFDESNSTNYSKFNTSDTYSTLDGTNGVWKTAILKPSESINNIYSFQLRFKSVPVRGLFMINNWGDGGENSSLPTFDNVLRSSATDTTVEARGATTSSTTITNDGGIYSDIEITDISIIYRSKSIK